MFAINFINDLTEVVLYLQVKLPQKIEITFENSFFELRAFKGLNKTLELANYINEKYEVKKVLVAQTSMYDEITFSTKNFIINLLLSDTAR